jgi:hypothetical protein
MQIVLVSFFNLVWSSWAVTSARDVNFHRNGEEKGKKMDEKFRDWKRKENVYCE